MKAKNILLILILLIIVGFIPIIVSQKLRQNKPGEVALRNAIRVRLSVPIIEKDMHPVYSIKTFLFQHWELNDLTPNDHHALHVTKRTGKDPLSDAIKEIDVYLKKENNDSITSLRIMSDIFGDTIAKRKAWLNFYDKSYTLDENGLDSIALSWKIFYLIRSDLDKK